MSSGQGRRPVAPTRSSEPEPDEPSPDDPEVGSSGLMGAPLVAQLLGGTVIDEQVDELS
jgi:DNA polymerase-3 subunit gamma/tau